MGPVNEGNLYKYIVCFTLEILLCHIFVLCEFLTGESVQPAVWLQTLMDACCTAADFSIQAVAISLVMDLVGLTQSVAMVTAERVASPDSGQPMSPSQGRVAVVIRPPLTPGILKYIAEKTGFFKVCIISSLVLILLKSLLLS